MGMPPSDITEGRRKEFAANFKSGNPKDEGFRRKTKGLTPKAFQRAKTIKPIRRDLTSEGLPQRGRQREAKPKGVLSCKVELERSYTPGIFKKYSC